MSRKHIILRQQDSFGLSLRLLLLLLLYCSCQMSVFGLQDEFDSDIEPPFRSSGVGDRQSAFRRVLHQQLERLTHAELKNEDDSAEHKEKQHEDEAEQHEERQNTKHREANENEKKRTYDDEHDNHAHNDHNDAEEVEQEERTYNPWHDSFQDIFEDGSYAYGYNLPNGVTRYERSFYSEKYKGRVVEGFYTQPRHFGKRILYELRCYRSDYYNGYRPLGVQYLRHQPIVERDTEPDVDCFDKH